MTSSPSIAVVGSINMDLVFRMNRLPKPGETVSGESFQAIPGGKGANQAIAATRLGARVKMIGRLGDDDFGRMLRKTLSSDGVETTAVLESTGGSSGVAMIGVEESGANFITVVPGANGQLSVADVERSRSLIESADALIVQLEIPIPTVAAAIGIARTKGILTVLDPAPVPTEKLPLDLYDVGIFTPNQTEAEELTGVAVYDWATAKTAARHLHAQGVKTVVMKLGVLGALVSERNGMACQVTARQAEVLDTTAAGDAFTAALTVAKCEGRSLVDATYFGCLAGTLACTRFGAQPSMPTRVEVDRWNDASR